MQNFTVFYQHGYLSTVKKGTCARLIARAGHLLLAELHREVQPQTVLLANDLQGSVILSRADHHASPHCYSPHGFEYAYLTDKSLLRYNGELFHRNLGGYLLGNGHRTYSPSLAHFHSPDLLSPFGAGGINCYAYVGLDPINRQDPSGRISIPVNRGNTSRPKSVFRNLLIPLTGASKHYPGIYKEVEGIQMYMSRHPQDKHARAITVSAHGNAQIDTGVISKNETWDARYFVDQVQKAGFDTKRYDMHVIACESGSPTRLGHSFIQQVANLTQRRAFGYRGEVFEDKRVIKSLNIIFNNVNQFPPIKYWKRDFNYQPVYASPRATLQRGNDYIRETQP